MLFDWSHLEWNTVFSVPTTDEMILAQGCVSLLSTALILIIIICCVAEFPNDTLTATKPIRYTSIISMLLFFIQSLLQLTTINNAFFPISRVTYWCQIFYTLQLMLYNLAKVCMFWLFSYQLQLLCNATYSNNSNSKLPISPILLNLYRISCLIISTLLWIAWIYFVFGDIRPHNTVTMDNKYQYCFPDRFPDSFIAENIIRGGMVLVDLIFSVSALVAFVAKCNQITVLISTHSCSNNKGLMEHTLIVMKKCTVLTTFVMISTNCYSIGGAYILRQIGFFLCFNGVIGSLCMACSFRCGDVLYDAIFSRMEKLLFCMFYIISCCCCVCCQYCQCDDGYQSDDHLIEETNEDDGRESNQSIIYNAEDVNPCMGVPTLSDVNTENFNFLPLKI